MHETLEETSFTKDPGGGPLNLPFLGRGVREDPNPFIHRFYPSGHILLSMSPLMYTEVSSLTKDPDFTETPETSPLYTHRGPFFPIRFDPTTGVFRSGFLPRPLSQPLPSSPTAVPRSPTS